MRRLVLVILACAVMLPSLAQAYDILVLQSRQDAAFEEVLKGFRNEQTASQRVIVLSAYAEVDLVRIVREDRPKLILAVGDAALTAARKVQNTPVIAVMSLGIHGPKVSQANLTGISMFAAPERYISMFQSMKIRRVGVVYNPVRSSWYLREARQEAERAGIELVTREVTSSRETSAQLSYLAGKVDALWMLPDVTAVTRESTESYFRFGQDHAIPVISFAGGYLGLGAAVVVEIDRFELGRQAGNMATALLSGSRVGDMRPVYPRGTSYKANSAVLMKLGPAYIEVNKLVTR